MKSIYAFCVFATLASMGCAGKSIDGGTGSQQTALQSATIEKYKAACADPTHGPVDSYSDVAGLTARLSGRWYSCEYGQGGDLYQSTQGIEFDADGTWSVLAIADDGTVTPLVGIEHQGTWSEDESPSYWDVGNDNGHYYTNFAFETNPRRMRTRVATEGEVETWFVPIE